MPGLWIVMSRLNSDNIMISKAISRISYMDSGTALVPSWTEDRIRPRLPGLEPPGGNLPQPITG